MTTNGTEKRPLPDGWHEVTLEDIAIVERGITFPSSVKQNEPFDGSIVCLRTTNVQDSVDWDDLLHVPRTYVKKDEKLLRQGDILISMANSRELVGKVSFVDRVKIKSSFGGFIAAIRAYPEILPRFLFYQLRTKEIRSFLQRNSSQTVNIANLSLQRLYPTPIYIAPIEEQERIVAEIEKQFTRLDQAVASLRRLQSNLARYKASVLKAACEGRLVPQDPNDEPAADLLARILAERRAQWQAANPGKKYKEPVGVEETAVLPDLPEGWVWATMPQLGELNRGKSKHRPRNDERLFGGPYPFIQTGEVRHADGFITNFTQTYSDFGLAQSRLWPKGTLCITIAANIAETAILAIDACFPDSVVGFIPTMGACDIRFVEYFIRTAKSKLEEFAPATAQKNINLQTLSQLSIPLPPLAEQERIVAEVERRLSVVTAVEQTITANLSRAERLRQSILHRAFTGQL